MTIGADHERRRERGFPVAGGLRLHGVLATSEASGRVASVAITTLDGASDSKLARRPLAPFSPSVTRRPPESLSLLPVTRHPSPVTMNETGPPTPRSLVSALDPLPPPSASPSCPPPATRLVTLGWAQGAKNWEIALTSRSPPGWLHNKLTGRHLSRKGHTRVRSRLRGEERRGV